MRKQNICIVTFPVSKSGTIPLSNLVDIISPLSDNLYLITGNNGYSFFREDKRLQTYGITHKINANVFKRIGGYVYAQIRIAHLSFKLRRKIGLYIFFIGSGSLILPMAILKFLDKDVILSLAEFPTKGAEARNDILSKPIDFLLRINCVLSNKIILHSPNLVEEWELGNYRNKILAAHEYYINFGLFNVKRNFGSRDCLIGYFGRLSKEKGIINFIEAIPKILDEKPNLKFLVGGDGELKDEIKIYIQNHNLNDSVKLLNWIPHDELPYYLNELKLLVIPSYTESGPIIALEAMACGTPVLSARVGHVANMIDDEFTGFIMENNSSECIATNVIRALNQTNLEQISRSAWNLVKKNFTYEAAVEKYRTVLRSI